MALQVCGVFIASIPTEDLDTNQPAVDKATITRLTNLSPKKLSVGFTDQSTIILLDLLFYKNISEESELTPLERDITSFIPNALIFIVLANDTVNSYAYSIIDHGKKVRTKAIMNGEVFLDYGDLLPSEEKTFQTFIAFLQEHYPEAYAKTMGYVAHQDEVQQKKSLLLYRDKIFDSKPNILKYTQGSWDEELCSRLVHAMTKMDYIEIEEKVDFVQFPKSKLNFSKESLESYVVTAWKVLRQKRNQR